MGGYEGAKKVADSLRREMKAEEKKEEKEMEVVKNQLTQISHNSELAKMYSDNSQVGSENLSGELPLLKVHSIGKSTKNELADGSEPKDGWFFYKPTREQFESIECHILTVSKGFRAEGMEPGSDSVFNQVIGGVIIGEGEMKPFVLYMTGLKLKNLWEFGKIASKYTRMKPVGIPMFAMTVKLTTEKVDNSFGKSWIIDFEIIKNEDNSPVLVLDPGEFQFLKDHVEIVEETITSIVAAKSLKEDDTELPGTPVDSIEKGTTGTGDGNENIPF